MDSNAVNGIPKRIESLSFNKKIIALFLNVSFHQHHRCYIKHEVTFRHNVSKIICSHVHFVKIDFFQSFIWQRQQPTLVWKNNLLTSSNFYFYVQAIFLILSQPKLLIFLFRECLLYLKSMQLYTVNQLYNIINYIQ